MSTQNENPVADLMEGLGMTDDATGNDADSTNVENNLSDSDTPTLTDGERSENSNETDTANTGDTETLENGNEMEEKLKAYELEIETYKKRISDKDKFINELQQNKNTQNQDGDDASTENIQTDDIELDDSFWDDPEGKFKALLNQMNSVKQEVATTNFRLDENMFARNVPDYYDVVNPQNIADMQQENPNFVTELQSQENKFQFAYDTLKGRVDSKRSAEEKARQEIEAEVLKKYNIDPNKVQGKQVPPSINNLGSSGGNKAKVGTDGFAEVFGYEG